MECLRASVSEIKFLYLGKLKQIYHEKDVGLLSGTRRFYFLLHSIEKGRKALPSTSFCLYRQPVRSFPPA